MNSEAQQTLCNLRMLGKIGKNQWIITKRGEDGELNIDGICDDGYYNNMCLSLNLDTWQATRESLKSIYCDKLYKLVNELMEEDENDDLKRIEQLVEKSIDGLKHIMDSYKESPSITAHLQSIKEDFAEALREKINMFLLEEGDIIRVSQDPNESDEDK